jgi:DNA-binding XRE family transcriptional regulator
MKKTFGERLEELRGDLSQRDFAKKIGVPLTSYTNWVLGVSQPKFENIYAICSSLGVSADWLLGLSGGSAASVPASGPVPAVHGGACAACAVKDARIDKLLAIIDKLAQGGGASGSRSAPSETA